MKIRKKIKNKMKSNIHNSDTKNVSIDDKWSLT